MACHRPIYKPQTASTEGRPSKNVFVFVLVFPCLLSTGYFLQILFPDLAGVGKAEAEGNGADDFIHGNHSDEDDLELTTK